MDVVLEISEAIGLVGENKYLDGITAFKLGTLGDCVKPYVKNYIKERDRIINDTRKKERVIKDILKEGQSEENKSMVTNQLSELSDKMQEQLNNLLDIEEEMKVPHLKLSDFIAKTDVTEVFATKEGTPETKVLVKASQALVPVKFFTLMGDIIEDDKNAAGG